LYPIENRHAILFAALFCIVDLREWWYGVG
jgi:hypothetical protein